MTPIEFRDLININRNYNDIPYYPNIKSIVGEGGYFNRIALFTKVRKCYNGIWYIVPIHESILLEGANDLEMGRLLYRLHEKAYKVVMFWKLYEGEFAHLNQVDDWQVSEEENYKITHK